MSADRPPEVPGRRRRSRGRRGSAKVARPHERNGSRRAAPLARRRPALADRLRGHAARAPDHARAARRRPGDACRARARGAAGRARLRVCSPCDRGRRRERPAEVVAGLVGKRTRLAVSDRCWASHLLELEQALPHATWRSAGAGRRAAAGREGRPRDRGARVPPARPPTVWQRRLLGGEIALIGRSEAEVSAEISRRLLAEGHEQGELRHRRQWRRIPPARTTSRGRRVIGRGEPVVCDFGGALRLGDGDRLLLGHHAHRRHRGSRRGVPGALRGAVPRAGGGRGGCDGWHAVRGRRPSGTRADRRRRLRRGVHPPHRPRHRDRGARGPLHGGRAIARRSSPATPSPSSPASTWPVGSARASRTSWSRPRTDRSHAIKLTTDSLSSRPRKGRSRGSWTRRACCRRGGVVERPRPRGCGSARRRGRAGRHLRPGARGVVERRGLAPLAGRGRRRRPGRCHRSGDSRPTRSRWRWSGSAASTSS